MSRRKKPEKPIERIFFTFAEAQEFLGVRSTKLIKQFGHRLNNKGIQLIATKNFQFGNPFVYTTLWSD